MLAVTESAIDPEATGASAVGLATLVSDPESGFFAIPLAAARCMPARREDTFRCGSVSRRHVAQSSTEKEAGGSRFGSARDTRANRAFTP